MEALACYDINLVVIPDPKNANPNHANITGYGDRKEDQIAIGQHLARAASKVELTKT